MGRRTKENKGFGLPPVDHTPDMPPVKHPRKADEIERSFEKLTSFEKLFLWLVMNPERGRKILEEMVSREQCAGAID